MPNIRDYLDKILRARYGKDVRGSIHDAIEAINDVCDGNVGVVSELTNRAETAAENVEQYKESAINASNEAMRAKNEAQTYSENSKQYSKDASELCSQAKEYSQKAEEYSSSALASMERSEEAENNAKQYKDSIETSLNEVIQAKNETQTYSEKSKEYSECAEEYSKQAEGHSNRTSELATRTEGLEKESEKLAELSKTYASDAKKYRDEAESIVGIDVMQGATGDRDGKAGLVPRPVAGDNEKFFCGDGTYKKINVEEKANGRGISFYIDENNRPHITFRVDQDIVYEDGKMVRTIKNDEVDEILNGVYSENRETKPDILVDQMIANSYDDDLSNDAQPDLLIDEMLKRVYS